MLDLVYILATVALFALVALIARGVERLGPWSGGSVQREAMDGGDRG